MRKTRIGFSHPLFAAFLTAAVTLLVVQCACAYVRDWPRIFNTAKGKIQVYQPQPETLKGNELYARSAVSVILKNEKSSSLGTVWFRSRVDTNRDTRITTLSDIRVVKIKFPKAPLKKSARLDAAVRTDFPKFDLVMSMDRFITSAGTAKDPPDLSTAPPEIIFVKHPTVLVSIDGEPMLRPISGQNLSRVVNTPFFIVFDQSAKDYYLYGEGDWYSTRDLQSNNWKSRIRPPSHVLKAFKDVESQVQSPEQPPLAPETPADVIVSTVPAELISSDGEPVYTSIVGSDLYYMKNTDRDVFYEKPSGIYYVLLSGRWYSSSSYSGPWSYVASDRLPSSFSRIPTDSVKGEVLYSVAGTREAAEARQDASIPQTATVRRSTTGPKVTYDGDPDWRRIENTSMDYAVNTAYQILRLDDRYYCCYEGVWYDSDYPYGPWAVSTYVPSEFQLIPPSCPLYNVKFVHVYNYTPDVVYVGYTSGYLGCYTYGPTVVWGTGYYYPGWRGSYYYPRPCTWGLGASFIFWSGDWAFGLGYGPGWFNYGYGWGNHWNWWWGPSGFFYFDYDISHRHRRHRDGDRYRHRYDGDRYHRDYDRDRYPRRQRNLYDRSRDDQRRFERRGDRFMSPTRPRGRDENNIFSDRSGNVYRRSRDGWQQRGNTGWSRPVPPPRRDAPRVRTQTPPSSLERDYRARQRGEVRENQVNQFGGGFFRDRSRGTSTQQGYGRGRSGGRQGNVERPTRSLNGGQSGGGRSYSGRRSSGGQSVGGRTSDGGRGSGRQPEGGRTSGGGRGSGGGRR